MIAIKRLQSIMWILVVAMGALSAYLINLRVATERNAVSAVERQIYATRGNIRYLELEFGARASLAQLEAWNVRDIRYSVPAVGQYLAGENQLARLDGVGPSGTALAAAPAVAPAAPPEAALAEAEPVASMVMPVKAEVKAMAPAPAVAVSAPAAKQTRVLAQTQAPARKAASGEFAIIPVAAAAEPVRLRAAVALSVARPESAPRIVKLMDKADPAQRRAMRLASLDKALLGLGKADPR